MNRLQRSTIFSVAALLFFSCATMLLADERPVVRVVILPNLVPDIAHQFVPMAVELPPLRADLRVPRAKIVGFVYCGADGQGGANALGIIYPEQSAPAPNSLSAFDCNSALPDLAKRVADSSGAPDWDEVVRVHITWTAWQLKFGLADVAGAAKEGSKAPALEGIGELKNYSTSDLQILPPPGDQYRFDVAIRFQGLTIVVAVFPSGTAKNPQTYLAPDAFLSAEISAAPGSANVLATARYGFIDGILKLYTPTFDVPIPIHGVSQTMVAKNVRVSGSDNMMTAAGQLFLGDLSYDATVHCEGSDLAVRQISLQPVASNCVAADLMERLRCQGQQMALAGSSNAVAAGLTNYYQGEPFHFSAVAQPLEFRLNDRKFTATFEGLKSSSRDSTISEAGRVSIQRIVGQATSGSR